MSEARPRFERALAAAARRCGVTRVVAAQRAVRLVEFGVVGASGALVNVAVLVALLDDVPASVAAFVAFFGAATWTFALNSRVTFETTDALSRRFARYLGVCSAGYVVYTALLLVCLRWLALPYWAAALPAVTGGGLLNYVGSERFALA